MGDLCSPPTFGVEEEYLLLDPVTGRPAPLADAVLADAARREPHGDGLQHELLRAQVEVATGVCTRLDEAAGQLRRLRRGLADAAAVHGARLVATGAAPWSADVPHDVRVTDAPRYRALAAMAPALVAEQLICGMHVHVGIDDRDLAVAVLGRVRADLPTVTALAANSPFWNDADTGFGSWRTVHWERWPVQGVPPAPDSAAGYDALVDTLLATGAIADRKQVYWDARLSEHLPTLELRSPDVQLTVEDAVVLAGLLRALVVTVAAEVRAGAAAVAADRAVLAAATWVAARETVAGDLFDVRRGVRRPGADVVADLLARVRPALVTAGDVDRVGSGVARIVRDGTGAARQRLLLAQEGPERLVAALARQTAG